MKKIAKTAVAALALVVALGAAGTDVEAAKKTKVKKVSVSADGLSKKKLTIAKGKSKTLKVAINGKTVKASKVSKKVSIKSKNSKIVKVTKNGKLTGKKAGTTKVTITSKDNKKKKVTLTVKVVKVAVKKVTAKAGKTTLKVGDKTKVTPTVKYTGKKKYAYTKLAYSSSNSKVAKVSSKGTVTAVAAGTAKITVKALDGSNKKATVTITVEDYKTVVTPKDAKDITVDVEFSDIAKLQEDVDAVAKLAVKKGEDVVLTLNGKEYTATFDGTNVLINGKKFTESEIAKNVKKVNVKFDVKADKLVAAVAFTPASVTKVTVGKAVFTEMKADSFKMGDKTYTYTVDGKNIVITGDVKADFEAVLKDYVTIEVK